MKDEYSNKKIQTSRFYFFLLTLNVSVHSLLTYILFNKKTAVILSVSPYVMGIFPSGYLQDSFNLYFIIIIFLVLKTMCLTDFSFFPCFSFNSLLFSELLGHVQLSFTIFVGILTIITSDIFLPYYFSISSEILVAYMLDHLILPGNNMYYYFIFHFIFSFVLVWVMSISISLMTLIF